MNRLLLRITVCTVIFLIGNVSYAQQTVFNVPSSEVVEKNSVYFQHQSNFRPWKPERYYHTDNNVAFGLGHNTELNASLYNIEAPESTNRAIGIGFRSAIPLLRKKFPEQEFKVTVGDMLPVSLDGHGAGNWGYGHLSGTIPKLNTRIIAGIGAGTEDIFGSDTVHFMGAIEQPLVKSEKVKLIADWMSGSHTYGFLTSGLAYKINDHVTVEVGYQIPNSPQSGRSGFTIQIEAKR